MRPSDPYNRMPERRRQLLSSADGKGVRLQRVPSLDSRLRKPERHRRRSGADGSRGPREFSFVGGIRAEHEIADAIVRRGVADWPQ